MADNITALDLLETRQKLDSGDITSRSLVEAYLEVIERHDPEVRAYIEVFDDAREAADQADQRRKRGENAPLLGIPIALKDNILQKGRNITAGSNILKGYKASYDATVTEKLKQAGAVFLGRTNLDEFAMGSSTEHSAFFLTKNPHDTTRVPGGSSGGSAAAVSMGGALLSFGSDTGGSIRQPASFCGVVGLKPTYGSVSRFGLIAMGSSLDVIGSFSKTVSDAQYVFDIIKGYDAKDSTSLPDSRYELQSKKEKLRVGVPRAFLTSGIHEGVMRNFEASLRRLAEQGYEIVDIELPRIHHSLAVYYVVMPAEVSTNLARFDGVKYGLHAEGGSMWGDMKKTRGEGFGPEPRRRILLGTYVLSAGYADQYYKKALGVRSLITEDFNHAFESVDVIATPTTPGPAFRFGEKSDPVSMYLEDIFTVPANLTGMPAISIPSGVVNVEGKSLPTGFQLVAPHCREDVLFQAGEVVFPKKQ